MGVAAMHPHATRHALSLRSTCSSPLPIMPRPLGPLLLLQCRLILRLAVQLVALQQRRCPACCCPAWPAAKHLPGSCSCCERTGACFAHQSILLQLLHAHRRRPASAHSLVLLLTLACLSTGMQQLLLQLRVGVGVLLLLLLLPGQGLCWHGPLSLRLPACLPMACFRGYPKSGRFPVPSPSCMAWPRCVPRDTPKCELTLQVTERLCGFPLGIPMIQSPSGAPGRHCTWLCTCAGSCSTCPRCSRGLWIMVWRAWRELCKVEGSMLAYGGVKAQHPARCW